MLHNSFNEILQISALFIYKDANWQGTRTFFPNIWKRNIRSCTDVNRCKHKFSFTGQVSQLRQQI